MKKKKSKEKQKNQSGKLTYDIKISCAACRSCSANSKFMVCMCGGPFSGYSDATTGEMIMYYYQCRLEKQTDEGIMFITAWIESKGAKQGANVELIGEEGLWEVKLVSLPPMKKTDLDNHKSVKGLKSIYFAR